MLDRVQWEWAESDPKSMAAFLASASKDEIPQRAYSTLAQAMARRNPAEALEWARQLPPERALESGNDAFREWRTGQPDAAVKWLGALPTEDPRRQPFLQNAFLGSADNAQTAAQFASMMTAAERAAARRAIENMTMAGERRTRLLNVLGAP